MNEISDSHIEALIKESLQRQALIDNLESVIIADVRQKARRAWIRRWARAIAFSFGLPLVLLVFFACTYLLIKEYGFTSFVPYFLAVPAMAVIYATYRALANFSPEEV